jgi:hypothetical protein
VAAFKKNLNDLVDLQVKHSKVCRFFHRL